MGRGVGEGSRGPVWTRARACACACQQDSNSDAGPGLLSFARPSFPPRYHHHHPDLQDIPNPKLTSSVRHLNPPFLLLLLLLLAFLLSLSDSSKPLSPHLPRWSRAVDSCGQNFVPNQHLVPEDPRLCWPTGTASGGAFICILSDTRKSGCFLARWGNGWDLGKLHSSSLPLGLDQMSSLPHYTWLCLCSASCKTTIARIVSCPEAKDAGTLLEPFDRFRWPFLPAARPRSTTTRRLSRAPPTQDRNARFASFFSGSLGPRSLRSRSKTFSPLMDEKQLLYAVQIASSPDQSLRQQANDFLRDVLTNADQYWTVSPRFPSC